MLTPPDFAYRVSGGDTAHFPRHGFNYDGERKGNRGRLPGNEHRPHRAPGGDTPVLGTALPCSSSRRRRTASATSFLRLSPVAPASTNPTFVASTWKCR